jgi:hypothetical protein
MHRLTQRPNRPRDDRAESDAVRHGSGWMNAA